MQYLRVEMDTRSQDSANLTHSTPGTNKSHRSKCSSEYSCNSVDLEREDTPHRGVYFGSDRRFEAEKERLSERVSTGDGISVGDCDHKTVLLNRISGGSFGEVYLGELKETGQRVGVKIEPRNLATQYLLHEGNVYRKLEGGPGMPRVHWFGHHGSEYSVLVMELLGPTIQHLFAQCSYKLSLKTVLMLADQMLSIIQHVHTHDFVHRDISPSNFMMGCGANAKKLYLIDFGHSKKVTSTFKYIPGRMRQSMTRPMVGTPRFASVFTHEGKEESRRDDLESLGFIWVYLLKGRLPWQGLPCHNHEEKLAKIHHMKRTLSLDVLCEGLPKEFASYIGYVRSLRVHDVPDYEDIKNFFRALAAKEGIQYDEEFDWHPQPESPPLEDEVFHEAPNFHTKEPSPLVTISH